MATPIAQTVADEERDRLIAEHASDENSALLNEDFMSAFASETVDCATIPPLQFHKVSSGSFTTPNKVRLPGISLSSSKGFTTGIPLSGTFPTPRSSAISALLGSNQMQSPQSPIVSEWSIWVWAPNRTGGDLLTELEALRKHTSEGLYTTEVCC